MLFLILILALSAAVPATSLEAPPVTIHAPAELSIEAASLAAILPEALDRIQTALQAPPLPAADLYLTSGRESGGLPAGLHGVMPEWAAGIALVHERTAVIRADRIGPYGQRRLENVLVHEMAHLVMSEAAGPAGRDAMPRWFREGVAGYIAHDGEWLDFIHLWLSPAASSRHPLAVIEGSFDRGDDEARRAAYAGAFSFISHTIETHGEASLGHVLARLREGRDFDDAWALATGATLRSDESDWSAGTKGTRRWVAIISSSVTLWGVITALFLMAGGVRRLRTRRIMREWDRLEPPDVEPDIDGDPH